MLTRYIGIDLGTSNVLIGIKKKGIILNEPCLIAVNIETNEVIAVGKEAKDIYGREPQNVKVINPLKDGVVADFELAEIMLNKLINKTKGLKSIIRPVVVIGCPNNITKVEENTLKELAEKVSARKVIIEKESILALLGAGMNIEEAKANAVVDIGGGTTNIAVVSLNGIVTSKTIKISGNYFDAEIIKYIKSNYKLSIGKITAEEIKINFVDLIKPLKKEKLEVKGKNILTGLPDKIEINQVEIKEALEDSINKLGKEIIKVLEQTPEELSGDINEKGIILTGGGSKIKGLNEVLEDKLNIPILTTSNPETCVIEGILILLEKKKRRKRH